MFISLQIRIWKNLCYSQSKTKRNLKSSFYYFFLVTVNTDSSLTKKRFCLVGNYNTNYFNSEKKPILLTYFVQQIVAVPLLTMWFQIMFSDIILNIILRLLDHFAQVFKARDSIRSVRYLEDNSA